MDKLPKVLIVSPTYNEIESIHSLITRIGTVREELANRYDLSLLVVDDNSPDGTSNAVKARNLDWIYILDRPGKGGLGPAYIAGFHWGLAKDFDYLCEIDADLSHQPEELVNLLDALAGHDLAIGTRWMPGGSVVNWPVSRQLISKVGTGYARIVLKLELKDITSGYRAFHREVLEKIELESIKTKGMIEVLNNLNLSGKVAFVLPENSQNVQLSARNIPGVTVTTVSHVSVYELMTYKHVVLTSDAVKLYEGVLG